ncbi:hypothetical protein D3C81_1215500 [compost metagenome]
MSCSYNPSNFSRDCVTFGIFEFYCCFFVSFKSFVKFNLNNFLVRQCELNVISIYNFVGSYSWNLTFKIDCVSCYNHLGASCCCLEVSRFVDKTSVDCCLNITLSPFSSTVVNASCRNFKFQCTYKYSCQFFYSNVTVKVEDFLSSVFTLHDYWSRRGYSFDERSCPVLSIVVLVFERVHASDFFQSKSLNDHFSKFCTSDCFLQVSGTIWITSKDTFCFQSIKLLLWSLGLSTECYRSKHGECHCCRQCYG